MRFVFATLFRLRHRLYIYAALCAVVVLWDPGSLIAYVLGLAGGFVGDFVTHYEQLKAETPRPVEKATDRSGAQAATLPARSPETKPTVPAPTPSPSWEEVRDGHPGVSPALKRILWLLLASAAIVYLLFCIYSYWIF